MSQLYLARASVVVSVKGMADVTRDTIGIGQLAAIVPNTILSPGGGGKVRTASELECADETYH